MPKFDLLEKADVVGVKTQPLFRFLRVNKPIQDNRDHEKDIDAPAGSVSFPFQHTPITASDVLWNFEKFIVDRYGKVRYRFLPSTEPTELKSYIEELLKEE